VIFLAVSADEYSDRGVMLVCVIAVTAIIGLLISSRKGGDDDQ
jgi:hypothetical protein